MKKSGFTLIEVLIATSIMSIVFTTIASVVAISLRNTSINTRRIIGTHMADELQEWLRGEKDDDWETYVTKTGMWCFNPEPVAVWGTKINNTSECAYAMSSNKFEYKRIATITQEGNVYKTKVEFTWVEGTLTQVYKVTNETYYSQW